MDVLKNRWREAKGTRTFPDIAEAADLSPSTVEYAFSPKSTNPSIGASGDTAFFQKTQ